MAFLHSFPLVPQASRLVKNETSNLITKLIPSLIYSDSTNKDSGSVPSLSSLLEDLYLDIDLIYRKQVNDLEEFKSIRNQIHTCLSKSCSREDLKTCLLLLINKTLYSCSVSQNSILAVDIFYFIRKVSEYMKDNEIINDFIPWSTIYSYSLVSILDTLSKVNLEILSGISVHCKLLEIKYPDPVLHSDTEIQQPVSFITSCIGSFNGAREDHNTTKLPPFTFAPLSSDEISIPCGLVIQIMFHLRSVAFHDKIPLDVSFYERLVDSFFTRGMSPAMFECLLNGIEMELNSKARVSIQRKIFHCLASLRSTRMLHRLKKPEERSMERYEDIPTMNIIILNLLLRSSSPSNYRRKDFLTINGEVDNIELINRKLRADFSLAMKFYSEITKNAHPSLLSFSLEKDLKISHDKKMGSFTDETVFSNYDHLQRLQHSVGCALLAQGRTEESFEIFKSLWNPFTRKKVRHLSVVRAGFVEDIFNICYEFSLNVENVFLPLIKMMGFSWGAAGFNASVAGLWQDLVMTRPSAIIPLFHILVCASSGATNNFGLLLTSWKDWIYSLHDECFILDKPILLPWTCDNSRPNGVVFIEISKSAYPQWTRKDFLWTPFLLDLLFPIICHSTRKDRIMPSSSSYRCTNGKQQDLSRSVTPFSDVYFGSSPFIGQKIDMPISPFVLKAISIFFFKELFHSPSSVSWHAAMLGRSAPALDLFEWLCFISDSFNDKQSTSLGFYLRAFDQMHLSSLLLLASGRSFDLFAKILCLPSTNAKGGNFDLIKSTLIALMDGTRYKNFIRDISNLTMKYPLRMLAPKASYALVLYYFTTIAFMREMEQHFAKIARNPLLNGPSVLLFMKALALSNHWYDFFCLVKNFIALVPFELKGILWALKDSFEYDSTPDSDLLFPRVKIELQDLPPFSSRVSIVGDAEKASVAVDMLVNLLHSSNLFVFNKFLIHEQLCSLLETKLHLKTIFCLRHAVVVNWDDICSVLCQELDLSSFSIRFHTEDASPMLSKEFIIKKIIIEPLRSALGATDFMKCLSELINHEFECMS